MTSNIGPSFLIDEAALGGGDFRVQDSQGYVPVAEISLNFPTGSPGSIQVTGIGFAAPGNLVHNDARSVDFRLDYLGANGVDDPESTGDDLLVGIVHNVAYQSTGQASELYIDLDQEMMELSFDGMNNLFQLSVRVDDLDPSITETLSFKTSGQPKLSLAGSFFPRAFEAGNVTTGIEGPFLLDQASLGGSDFNINEGDGYRSLGITTLSVPSNVISTIFINGFGFAHPNSPSKNTAELIDLKFEYLGADGIVGGGDDILLGEVEDIAFTFGGSASENFVNFGADGIVAALDGDNNAFRVSMRVKDNSPGQDAKLALKSSGNPKISLGGSIEAGYLAWLPPGLPEMNSAVLEFSDKFDEESFEGFEVGYPFSDPNCHAGNNNSYYQQDCVNIEGGNYHLLTKLIDPIVKYSASKNQTYTYRWGSGMFHRKNVDLSTGSVYIEAEMKLPDSELGWPAMWLTSVVGWPPEIDVLEQPVTYNFDQYYVAIHRPANRPAVGGGRDGGGNKVVSKDTSGWNRYGVFIDDHKIEFFFNGESVRTIAPAGETTYSQGMRHPYHLIFNHAVGSGAAWNTGWGGKLNDMVDLWETSQPNEEETTMGIAQVRIWRAD